VALSVSFSFFVIRKGWLFFCAFAPLSVNLFRLNDMQFCPFARTKIQLHLFLRATDDAMRSSRVFRRFIHFTFRGDPSEKRHCDRRLYFLLRLSG
jgi:hypothetical protein